MVWYSTKLMTFIKTEMKGKRVGEKWGVGLKEGFEAVMLWSALTTMVHKQHSNNQSTVHCRSLRIHDYIAGLGWWAFYDRPARITFFFNVRILLSPTW